MVNALPEPVRPLIGGLGWYWSWRSPSPAIPWTWCRIYHRTSVYSDGAEHRINGATHRGFGPLHRLDPHIPADDGSSRACPDGRTVLYVAGSLLVALGEVFGEAGVVELCPELRVALLRPAAPIATLDLRGEGTAISIGALPSLATGDYPRRRTQQWARAIFEDQPVPDSKVSGVYYSAAYSNCEALALWNTDTQVEVVVGSDGGEQDFALADISDRVAVESRRLRLAVEHVSRCARCPL